MWWHLEHELRQFTVTPVVKRALKKGGLSAGQRVSAGKLLDLLGVPHTHRKFDQLGMAGRLKPGTPLPTPAGVFPRYVEPAEEKPN